MYSIDQLEEALINDFREREFKVRLDSIAHYLAYLVDHNKKIINNDFIMKLMKVEDLVTISENDKYLSLTKKGKSLYEKFKADGYYLNKEKTKIKVL